jgi:hypothetical protein
MKQFDKNGEKSNLAGTTTVNPESNAAGETNNAVGPKVYTLDDDQFADFERNMRHSGDQREASDVLAKIEKALKHVHDIC